MEHSFLDSILSKQVVFFTGKGGVGKSAVASATALACQKKNKTVFLISWNPMDTRARTLPYEALGIKHLVLSATGCFREYALKILKFEGLVDLLLENKMVGTFISAAPGLSEAVIAGKIWDLTVHHPEALVLVDLPASGHAYSFFSSPLALRKLFKVGLVHREIERICDLYFSEKTALQLVALPEELPVSETLELRTKLMALGPFNFLPVILNQCLPQWPGEPLQVELAESLLSSASLPLFRHFVFLNRQNQESVSVLTEKRIPFFSLPRLTCPEWITTVEKMKELLATL